MSEDPAAPAPLLPPDLVLDEDPFDVERQVDEIVFWAGEAEARPDQTAATLVEVIIDRPDELTEQGLRPAGFGWQIRNEDDAEYAMRHTARCDRQLQELNTREGAYVAKIHLWARRERDPLLARRGFFAEHLRRWGLARRAAGGPRDPKQFRVPSGVVRTTVSDVPRLEVTDEAVFLAWADQNLNADQYEAAVKVTKSARLSGIGKIVTTKVDLGEETVQVVFGDEIVPGVAGFLVAPSATVTPEL